MKATDSETHREVMLRVIPALCPLPPPAPHSVKVLEGMQHQHLAEVLDYIEVPPGEGGEHVLGFRALVLEYYPNPVLKDEVAQGRIPEPLMGWIEGVLGGLETLHAKGVTHGNLRPSSIILQDIGHVHVRLTDYGLPAHTAELDHLHQAHPADLLYLAPEQIAPSQYGKGGKVHENADFWALGVLLYEMFTGTHPYAPAGATAKDISTAILAAATPPSVSAIPQPYQNLVLACLTRDASERPQTVAQLRKILRGEIHWVNGKAEGPPAHPNVPLACPNCHTLNDRTQTRCVNCNHPLMGPYFIGDYRRTGGLALWSILFLILSFLPIAFIFSGLYELYTQEPDLVGAVNRVAQSWEFESPIAQERAAGFGQGLAIFFLASSLLYSLFFWLWYAKAHRNLTALGVQKPRFHVLFVGMADAVMWLALFGTLYLPALIFVVPLARLVTLGAMQELWKGSNPYFLYEGEQWRQAPGSFLIFLWWFTGTAWPLLLLLPMMAVDYLGYNLEARYYIYWAAVAMAGLHLLLSVWMIGATSGRQRSKLNAWMTA